MGFTAGKGRPPTGNVIVGDVEWDEECNCWAGTSGFYWHGTKLGGWKKTPPDIDLTPDEKRRRIEAATQGAVKMPRARPPTGNALVGLEVTYNPDLKCFATNKDFYWHGTYNGGWRTYAPGFEPPLGEADIKREMGGTGNTKGRRPRPPFPGDSVDYDTKRGRWVSSSGLIWLGTYSGGWKKDPGKDKPKSKHKSLADKAQKKRKREGGNKKGRRPAAPKGGGSVEYSTEHSCWFCTGLGIKYWHGSYKGGWQNFPPGRVVEVVGEVIEDDDDETVTEEETDEKMEEAGEKKVRKEKNDEIDEEDEESNEQKEEIVDTNEDKDEKFEETDEINDTNEDIDEANEINEEIDATNAAEIGDANVTNEEICEVEEVNEETEGETETNEDIEEKTETNKEMEAKFETNKEIEATI